jgi:hypothetical protein
MPMKKFFRNATISLLAFSSLGFSGLLFLCAFSNPFLQAEIAVGVDAYLFIMCACFASVILAALFHTLYLREKLYEQRKY